ncbi:MAG TPA: thiamine-phosphate kinase [Gemmatimonadales bacterium]|nr:thiamine-phosphate kinase [Gemmatimonadales bacterium]
MKGGASSGHLALGPGAEFDRIRALARALGRRARGLGDDCALLSDVTGTLAISTDVSVERVHFRLDWITAEEAGWRAAATALSDLAAEGAEPLGLVSAITVPDGAEDADLTALATGIGEAADAAGAAVLGGDLSRGPAWSVAVTVIGRAERPVTRGGARVGDAVWLTGALGGSRAAVESWRRGETPTPDARRAYAHPEPRIWAGRWLAGHGARAMLDLSDGLAADAGHLAAASGVRIRLRLETVPVAAAAIAEARRLAVPLQQFAAEGGDDYELLVAVPPEFGDADARAFESATGLALTRIGAVERGSGVRAELLGRGLELRGYDHFR